MPWANRRLRVETLERRQMLSGTPWFEDSGQEPGQNSAAALGDLNGDGHLDAFVGCYAGPGFEGQCRESSVWLNDGQGTFSRAWSTPATNVLSVALADLDADGDVDVFVGRGTPYATAGNQVLLNDGSGNFTKTGQNLGRGISWDVRLADVDNDGDDDAVVANMVGVNGTGGGSPSQVWLNDGHGSFEKSDQDLAGKQAFSVALGDLDGDGDFDAYLAGGWTRPADHVLINDGTGNFFDSNQELGRGYATSVQLGDLDADGDLDAFISHGGFGGGGTNQPNDIWVNDGSGHFTNSGQRVGNEITIWAALGDVDGDDDLDVFYVNGTHNASAQTKRIWLNDGRGNFRDSGEDIGVRSWGFSVALGDLDSDLDAFVGNLNRPNEVWLNVRPMPGDANRDGHFDQRDIVLVLQSGKYNTGEPADFGEGDWNQDGVFDQLDIVTALQLGEFDQLDLVRVQTSAKYLTGEAATWGEGDWDGAPAGSQGNPPAGDGRFNQFDIIAAQQGGAYLTGPYAAVQPDATIGDGQTSVIYDAGTGELGVDAPVGVELTSINIDFATGVLTGETAANLGRSFDNDADNNIFKATFGGSFGSLRFGNVAQAGLSEEFVLNDLSVVGSLAGGGDLGNFDLVYVPEPTSAVLLSIGLVIGLSRVRRKTCRLWEGMVCIQVSPLGSPLVRAFPCAHVLPARLSSSSVHSPSIATQATRIVWNPTRRSFLRTYRR